MSGSGWLGLGRGAVLSAALVGIVGAAGVYLYEQVYAEKRRAMLVKDMARLDQQVMSMRAELESLRELQKESQLKRAKQRRLRPKRAVKPAASGDQVDGGVDVSYASDSEYMTDYQSVVGTDGEFEDDEFYDVHSDSEREESIAGGRSRPDSAAKQLRSKADKLDLDEEELVPNGTKPT